MSWILVTALLLYVHSIGRLFIFLQSPTLSYVGFIPQMLPSSIRVLFECMCLWTAVELLLEGWLLAALALHLHGEWAEGLVVFVLTQLVPPEQRDPHGSGRIPQN